MPRPLKLHQPAPDTTNPVDPLDRERLIDRAEYQGLLNVGQATFERWLARKRVLPPIVLSRTCHRWRLGDVVDWLRAGCPDPTEWLKGRC